ncbi:hypothetical protein BH23THE1_BH23THE1_31920 [soil metagenome]
MIQYALLIILIISISTNIPGTVHARQNISEEIYHMFGNLTPDYLGFKNFSYELSNNSLTNSLPSINTSNNSTMNR